jgi:hypothetical protein
MPITPAKEVKQRIEQIKEKLVAVQEEAVKLGKDSGPPLYIGVFGQYMNAKMAQILFTVDRTLEKIPEHFRGET